MANMGAEAGRCKHISTRTSLQEAAAAAAAAAQRSCYKRLFPASRDMQKQVGHQAACALESAFQFCRCGQHTSAGVISAGNNSSTSSSGNIRNKIVTAAAAAAVAVTTAEFVEVYMAQENIHVSLPSCKAFVRQMPTRKAFVLMKLQNLFACDRYVWSRFVNGHLAWSYKLTWASSSGWAIGCLAAVFAMVSAMCLGGRRALPTGQ